VIRDNPFEPGVEGVPFLLTLDAWSFESLEGDERGAAEYLCQLCRAPAIDAIEGLWGWKGTPLIAGIPQTELGPVEDDARVVRRVGEAAGCYIGGIRIWSQFARYADEQGYDEKERERFTYYAALNGVNHRQDRHFLVTADRRLLEECEGQKGFFRRGREGMRITTVAHALFLCGLVMKAHRRVYYEVRRRGETIYTSRQNIYEYLSQDMLEPYKRIADVVRPGDKQSGDFYRSEQEALVEGLFDRVIDILRARDRIALANSREQDDEVLDDIRYDLRSMIAAVAGAVDGIAVLAQIAFPFEVRDNSRINLRDQDFRKAIKGLGAIRLAKTAGDLMPFLRFLWSLRNPIFHRHGLPGYTLHQLPGARLSQITLSPTQVDLLDKCCRDRKETAEHWGLRNRNVGGLDPSVDPWPFAAHLAVAGIGAIRRLCSALVDDAGVEEFAIPRSAAERDAIRRFRWLSGFPLEGR
jgi:hypothetical protein